MPLPEEDVARLEAGYSLHPLERNLILCCSIVVSLFEMLGGRYCKVEMFEEVLFDDGKEAKILVKEVSARHACGVVVKLGGVMEKNADFTLGNLLALAVTGVQLPRSVVDLYTAGENNDGCDHYRGGYREYWRNVKEAKENVGH